MLRMYSESALVISFEKDILFIYIEAVFKKVRYKFTSFTDPFLFNSPTTYRFIQFLQLNFILTFIKIYIRFDISKRELYNNNNKNLIQSTYIFTTKVFALIINYMRCALLKSIWGHFSCQNDELNIKSLYFSGMYVYYFTGVYRDTDRLNIKRVEMCW